jgi:two-component system, chemotaxis family, CheB/CheR fusion protein
VSAAPKPPDNDDAFEALLEYLKRSRGFDFTGYKRASLRRRLTRRMQVQQIDSCGDYLDYLEVHPEEFGLLFNTILINVTAFFRDAPAWAFLASEIIPQLISGKLPGAPIRVWSAGCASGEEAYTMAIILAEALGWDEFRHRVKIYATDVDEHALAQARQAIYDAKAVKAVPPELLDKYFERVGPHYVFRADLRRAMIFGRHDLIQDAPIPRLDLVMCRNILMYFNAEVQARVLARFHFALNDQGFLFLGRAEMLLTHTSLFTPMNLKHRIFTKVSNPQLRERLLVLAQAGSSEANNHVVRHVRLRDIAFDVSEVGQIVLDLDGNVVLVNEQARVFFGLHRRDLGRPFHDLELSYRPLELRSRIEQAYVTRRPVRLINVERTLPTQETQFFDIAIVPLIDSEANVLGTSINFQDVTRPNRLQAELEKSKQELETAYEELQSTNEELETTNEELQSTVEELETTNEELQSTNEELETMNEQLQSSNEEMQAINIEFCRRTDEANRANSFLGSILSSLHHVAMVLDREFNILMWNERASDLWGLRAEEVRGRSILGLDIGLPVEQLHAPIRAVLSGESAQRQIILNAMTRRGRSIQCRLTCTRLMGPGEGIDGTILLMEEVHESRPPETHNSG